MILQKNEIPVEKIQLKQIEHLYVMWVWACWMLNKIYI